LEFTPNGPPNIAEFGTGFKGLYAMDAYQLQGVDRSILISSNLIPTSLTRVQTPA
jgi:hypothetical protein